MRGGSVLNALSRARALKFFLRFVVGTSAWICYNMPQMKQALIDCRDLRRASMEKGCTAMTGNTYCGNLLWQRGLTLLPHDKPMSPRQEYKLA